MKKSTLLFGMFLLLAGCTSVAQPGEVANRGNGFSVLSWNVENMFDVEDDTLTRDEEFTPDGIRDWDSYRYYLKARMIWKTILSVAPSHPPEIIALCEIENEKVLRDIFIRSPFGNFNYRIIHHDSPDPRGIDVALVYDPSCFEVVDTAFIQPSLSGSHPTRDILYAALRHGTDTLHVFVNHWPSKYGGPGYTEPFRKEAAATLRRLADSVEQNHPGAYIICCGDFNDTPESVSIMQFMQETGIADTLIHCRFRHLIPEGKRAEGTIRFQGNWQKIDHYFVSEPFFNHNPVFRTDCSLVKICDPDFLVEPDEKYGGIKPFRTFEGMRYNGGVSDHLPVMLFVEAGKGP